MKLLKWIGAGLGVLIAALVLVAVFLDWNVLRGPIADRASQATHRAVRIDGDLTVHLLSLTPSVTINGLKVGNPDWAGKDEMLSVDRVTVAVRLPALLKGDLVLPLVEIRKPALYLVRQASSRANWDFDTAKTPKEKAEPVRIPTIQRFIVTDGHLTIDDRLRKLLFVGALESRETTRADGTKGFRLEGKGALNREPFQLSVTGGPLINLEPGKPYPFDADIRAGATRVVAHGTIPKPFDMAHFETALTVSGDDLADLYYLSGLALPNTPPYRLSGVLRRDGTRFDFNKFAGKIGDSDISGDVGVETASGRPKVTADLTSKLLDFNDLGTLVGAPPSTKAGEAVSPRQRAQAARMAAQNRLLPDAPLQVERIRGMDANVTFHARSVKAPNLPLKTVSLKLTLDHGVLTIAPVSFEMPQGRLKADLRLDARKAVPVTDLDARLTDVRLEEFAAKPGAPSPISGMLQARAKLHMTGDTVHRAASTADGTVTVVIPRGQIRAAFAELISVNAAKGLGLLLTKDQSQAEIRCAVVNMPAKKGLLTVQTMVFDTEPTIVTGSGNVDLKTERLNLTIEGNAKHPSVFHIMAPIGIDGHLRKPDISVKPAKPAAQVATAVALGVLLTPIASILPFIDPGLADDANCGALLAEAKSTGTSVRSKAPAAPAPSPRRGR